MSLSSSAPWLKYYGNVPHHLSYPQKTIYQMVKAAAERNPKLPAYEFMGKKTTFTQFMQKIDETAQAFLAMGIKKGDRVTICMPNCPQALHAFYGLNRIGAVSNMIHPLSAAGEIRFYLNFSHSKCILTLDQFYAKIAPIMPELDDPDCKLLLAKIEDELYPHLALGYALTAARKYPKPPKKGNYIWWSEFQRVGKKRDLPLPREFGKAEEGASILYSGGTTGTTKGILLSNMNFNALGLQTIAASGFAPINGMKMLSVMPVFHGFGLGIGIHTALIGGACCILVPKFNVNTYAELLIKKQPNIIPGVPTLFEALLRAEKLENADLSCLKGVFSGGDSMSIELKKKVDDFLKAHNASVQVRQGYGLTECVTASCLTPKDYNRVGSIGVPFPDTYYKIVKPGTKQELDANLEGEICVSGPSVMLEYVDNPEETHNTLRRHEDGRIWLHTGDLGKMDEDGFVNLPVNGGFHLKEVAMGKNIVNYDSMLVLTHFKGHAMGGFGGSMKNIAIGCASGQVGKRQVHGIEGEPPADWNAWPAKEKLMELMADSAKATIDHFGKRITYINVMRNMSVDCDCAGVAAAKPTIADIGILASTDLLAIDQACVDLVYSHHGDNRDLVERMESRHGLRQLTAMAEHKMGNTQYELIEID